MDTAAKEREVEERLKKEQERLQRQLEEDKNRGPERKPRDRDRSQAAFPTPPTRCCYSVVGYKELIHGWSKLRAIYKCNFWREKERENQPEGMKPKLRMICDDLRVKRQQETNVGSRRNGRAVVF